MRVVFALCICASIMFTACDATRPEALEQEKDTISVVQPIADATLRLDDGYVIDLHEHFRHSAGGALFFTVVSEGEAVQARVADGVLEVTPRGAGTATLIVTATGPDAASTVVRFRIHVRCPTEVGGDEVSYFPHDLGQEWSYEYREYSYPKQTSPYENTTTGILRWRVTELVEGCSSIYLEITEVFEGTRERRFMGRDDTTVAVGWEKKLAAQLDGSRLILEGYTDGEFTGLDSLRWIHPRTAPEEVQVDTTVFCGFGGCTEVGYGLQGGVGITRWSYRSHHRDVYTKELTLRR